MGYQDPTHRRVLGPPVFVRIGGILLVHARHEGGADARGGLLKVLTHAPKQVTRPPSPCLRVASIHVAADVVLRVELRVHAYSAR